MINPTKDSQSNDNPYGTYTQDNQNWENERQRLREQEQHQRMMDDMREQQRIQDQQRRQREQQQKREEAKRRAATNAKRRKATQPKANTARKSSSASESGDTFKNVVTVIGFLLGGLYTLGATENYIVAGIAGAIFAFVLRKTYKLLLALALLGGIGYLFFGS